MLINRLPGILLRYKWWVWLLSSGYRLVLSGTGKWLFYCVYPINYIIHTADFSIHVPTGEICITV